MSERAVAIRLKIPDNEAYTALQTLRLLGVAVDRLERSEIWRVEDEGDAATLAARIEANEAVFNPNKHRLLVLEATAPRAGEAWIGELGKPGETGGYLGGKIIPGLVRANRLVGWRLFDASGSPVSSEVLSAAVERLLCNPAIEEALT